MLVTRKIKSLFLLPAIVVCGLLGIASLVMALRGETDALAWWSALIAALPLPLVIARITWTEAPRTPENEPLALLVASAGTLVAAWEYLIDGSSGWLPLAAAALGLLLLVLYVFWYSRFGRIASGKLDVGSKLPEFSLTDVDGNPVSSTDLAGTPAVLIFFRGNWSAVCRGQVAEVAAYSERLAALGARVTLISPQPASASRELAEKYGVPYQFWVDEGNRVAAALDIAAAFGVPAGVRGDYAPDTVMPTVVATNARGTILYSDQTDNYRLRPEPDLFIAVLRRAGAIAS
ncbi:MAG: redoxin domain-containing protein [Woeseiaceae bacterium]|nr:redoxin domain-containing protein [Woeseiaceae bacterium]